MVVNDLIGVAMRLYRKSPLYPRYGATLAKVLALVTRSGSTKLVQRTINGLRFELDLSQVIDASMYYSGTFEALAEKAISASLAEGMTAIDIGANFGYHTLGMAHSVGPSGKVIAIEPTTWAYDKLVRNASLNTFSNIEFLKLGLSDREEGAVDIAFKSSYRLDGKGDVHHESVIITTLDALLEKLQIPLVQFIKMDVDGYEGKVLRGARKLLTEHRPIIFFEISPSLMLTNGDSAQDLVQMLQELGYVFRSESGGEIQDAMTYCLGIADGYSVNLLALPSSP